MTSRDDPARPQFSLAAQPPGKARGRPTAVLIVDPDIEGGRRLAAALAPRAVVVVGSARAAFEAIRVRMPDLIVAELTLPDMSGIEFIARVHDAPATRNVLLLVATQRGSVRDKIAAFQAGADDYLVKPVDAQQFIAHVQLVSRFLQVLGRE